MRGQFLKKLFSLGIVVVCLGGLLTTLSWYLSDNNKNHTAPVRQEVPQQADDLSSGYREIIDKVNRLYAQTWEKKEDKSKKFRSELSSKCQGFEKAIITQANTVVGSKIVYDGERKRSVKVSTEMFNTFAKEHPFPNKTYKTCAVVGNGGILSDSGCGKMIDSAQFVIRCNMPPLNNGYQDHVGVKTDLVTANPSILVEKYGALMGRRRPFIESLRSYGNSLLLIPAFSYGHNTPVSLRAFYSIEDFGSPTRTIFFNPQYLQKLAVFWRSKGLRAVRLSTGLMVASLALELCSNVHLFGFWPFSNHPHGLRTLKNHYYDDIQTKKKFHAMPVEFELLLQLHTEGVLRLHLDDCVPGEVNLMGSTGGDGPPL